MPKLDGTHIVSRLTDRLADLVSGKDVALRDIKALLTEEQIAKIDEAWEEQKTHRKEQIKAGEDKVVAIKKKTKREIYINAYKLALVEAQSSERDAYKKRANKAAARAAKIYLVSYFAERDDGKDVWQAHSAATNELKRAHLAMAEEKRLTRRDKEVRALEEKIMVEIRKKMSANEVEQIELFEEHKRLLKKKKTKGVDAAGQARR